ncbi:MAG: leucine--tRNA ligase [Candidatus Altiarchaeales archaeon]|nr:leucine--tRNA ligase [Candidatus Altiarchaeales archaeon]
MGFDFRDIEDRWQRKWEEDGVYESNPNPEESFYLTVAYPYPSGGMHIGHARTYTVPDVICRFKRMQGYNVLFPMAWHVTGTPIIGALKRMKAGEEKQIRILKDVYSMTEEEMAEIKEPMDFARYFIRNHYLNSMKRLGISIDWRRQFTTNDRHYNQFITWQYQSLKERGLIKKGLHPVKYCVQEKNPVTTHDLLEGEDADTQEYVLLKFQLKDGRRLVAATLRPETIYGQTNMWVNPDVDYVEAEVEGETWIISGPCAEKLRLQEKKIEIKKKVGGASLLGEYCLAPGINREIIILPSSFPDPEIGTGLVTSVPSDAPYDYTALMDLKQNKDEAGRYGLDFEEIRDIEIIPIIKIEGWGEYPAKDAVEKYGIKNQLDIEKLERATKEIYKEGFHSGFMTEYCGAYKNMAVARAKEKIRRKLLDEGDADLMLEFSEKTVCRCGGQVVVAKAESWFIDYGNEDWKEQVRGAIHNLNTIPARTKSDYMNTVDWLHQWPCIRNFGLGTKLPFDDRFVIEPLSDSTIYMAYYTISHLIKDIEAEKLTPAFFDCIFRGTVDKEKVADETDIPIEKIGEIKKSFDYWYPQNWRCSALELIQNHLTFMLYHHCALFNGDKWPQGIATFGMGLLEGSKMSSSKGNVVLVKEAVGEFGADVIRLFLMGNAEPWQDFDWRRQQVKSTANKLQHLWEIISNINQHEETGEDDVDLWLKSRVHAVAGETAAALEEFQTRKALQTAFYSLLKDYNWYVRRKGRPNKKTLKDVYNIWVRLLAPFTPHICEQLWREIGGEGYVSEARYPCPDETLRRGDLETGENLIASVADDIQNILQATGKKPEKIHLYAAEEWKYKVYDAILEGKKIKDVMADPELRSHGKQVAKLMQQRRDMLPETLLQRTREAGALKSAIRFLSQQFNCEVNVHKDADYDPENKIKSAQPMKPGIYIE